MAVNGLYPIDRIRGDFPILSEEVHGKPLVYLDNGASKKPSAVIDQISKTYETGYANVHRGVHYMSQIATDAMEDARRMDRCFLTRPTKRK